jgi:hypothetical protein
MGRQKREFRVKHCLIPEFNKRVLKRVKTAVKMKENGFKCPFNGVFLFKKMSPLIRVDSS